MFPVQAKWVVCEINIDYDLCQAFSHLPLIEHPNKENYIAVYSSCTSATKRHNAPTLAPIPDALANVLIFHRHWLSPIHLSCSLGHAESAILDSAPNNNWFHLSLLYAANWLKINNRFFQHFDHMFSSIIFTRPPNTFPIAQ
ncbi:28812_t:CDS:2, partial [Gigaspora margarita]